MVIDGGQVKIFTGAVALGLLSRKSSSELEKFARGKEISSSIDEGPGDSLQRDKKEAVGITRWVSRRGDGRRK